MNENKREFKLDYGGKEVIVETGRLAKQADGSVLVSSAGTQVLVTVCSAHEAKPGQDFFPLMVDYVTKYYSAGKFLGGFIKREARPSTAETLNARLIDRPLRPLFPKGYMCETIVSATVMSYNPAGDPEVLASLGASAALMISDIPFAGPIGTCKVGKIDGKLVINPDHEQWEESTLEMVVAASNDAILMVEGEGQESSEQEMVEAISFAHEHIKGYCNLLSSMQKEVGKVKREFVTVAPNTTMLDKVTADFSGDARACLEISQKLERYKAIKQIEKKVAEAMKENAASFGLEEDAEFSKHAYSAVDELMYEMMRKDILEDEKRIAGRGLNEVRAIETESNVLETPHGSSLFTRGETQVMALATIGGSSGDQMQDGITGVNHNKFYLHYNFPPFSVGEARGKFNTSRRELGHGNLAQRALEAVMPSQDDFAYTVRLVCEVLESNGSSSMASVCSGSMALMDAGVPLKAPVAGIAMGLISDGKNHKILSDILGDEDHLGDMDFKVAGTADGITAIQMDIKIGGLSMDIISQALDQAKEGRMHILGEMAKTITVERKSFKEGVPRIKTCKISPDKIGALIGPGGKNIKALQENYEVTIECVEDGTIKVLGIEEPKIDECLGLINLQINGPEVNSEYPAEVVSIKDYGVFVDIAAGVSGLVHVSEIASERVKDINDYLDVGMKVDVKVIDIDRMGRIKFSIKAVKPVPRKP
ncbi:MAG: polyribonucleotide nucleotidyltransferase [Bacteriovoracaceae bacterium]|nr:polyribonucleotide nucleotidyltransferase [Bacteriovoracaceae bacterium]